MSATETIQGRFGRLFGARTRKPQAGHRRPSLPTRTDDRPGVAISFREVDAPATTMVMTVCGKVDSGCYRSVLGKCEQLHERGVERLVIDLRAASGMQLTCMYALHCVAKIFRGEAYACPEEGLRGLHRVADENFAAGLHPHVSLLVSDEELMQQLQQIDLHEVFPIHTTEEACLAALDSHEFVGSTI